MKVKDIIRYAKSGDISSKQIIYDRYYYIVEEILENRQCNLSFDKIYNIYKSVVDDYLGIEYSANITTYIRKKIKPALNKYVSTTLISEYMELAENGEVESKQIIYDRYRYIADKFYQIYSKYVTADDVYRLYYKFVDDYLKTDYPLNISAYIHNQFKTNLRAYLPEKITLSEYMKLAAAGNIAAREKLINHFSKVILRKAMDYDYLEYDDLVQYGMIKLIEIIDNNLDSGNAQLLANTINNGINRYFGTGLKNAFNFGEFDYLADDHDSYIAAIDEAKSRKFTKFVGELESLDLIESSNITDRQKLYAIKHIVEGLGVSEIGREYGCSKQTASFQIQEAKREIKRYFKIK